MPRIKKSLLDEYLSFVGLIDLHKPKRLDQNSKRLSYPIDYIIFLSEEDRKLIKEDSEKMKSLVKI